MAEESGPLCDLFLRIAGAKLGTMGSEMLGGGSQSLVAAGAGSRAVRNIFSNMPNVLNMDVMSELIRDPQLLATMLSKPKSEQAQLKLGQKILDFFGSQGITISRRPAPTAIREFAEDIFEDVVPPLEVEEEPEVVPPRLPQTTDPFTATQPPPQPTPPPVAPPQAAAPAPINPVMLQRAAQVLGPQDEIGALAAEMLMRQRPS
jgi:hypothetical protein